MHVHAYYYAVKKILSTGKKEASRVAEQKGKDSINNT